MKYVIASILALGLSACATTPTASQVQQIKAACALDAGIRPVVNVLLAVSNLATPEQSAAILAAMAVIDPICANPEGNPSDNALAAVIGATTQISAIAADLEKKKSE